MDNSEAVTTIYNYFKLYPQIYPGAYFRFLKANIAKSLSDNTYIHKDNTYLAWKIDKYGEVLLDKLVTGTRGQGKGRAVLDEFLERFRGKTINLKVLKDNLVAQRIYLSRGFKYTNVDNDGNPIPFGNLLLMRHMP